MAYRIDVEAFKTELRAFWDAREQIELPSPEGYEEYTKKVSALLEEHFPGAGVFIDLALYWENDIMDWAGYEEKDPDET